MPSSSSRSGRFGRIGFGDQHVAVRQHVQPARMVEAGGERGHRQPLRGDGVTPLGQPMAGAMLTVGSSELSGGGSLGAGRCRRTPATRLCCHKRRLPRR